MFRGEVDSTYFILTKGAFSTDPDERDTPEIHISRYGQEDAFFHHSWDIDSHGPGDVWASEPDTDSEGWSIVKLIDENWLILLMGVPEEGLGRIVRELEDAKPPESTVQ